MVVRGFVNSSTYQYHDPKSTTPHLRLVVVCTVFALLPVILSWRSRDNGAETCLNRYKSSIETTRDHPVEVLTRTARLDFAELNLRQSKSWTGVVAEYKRRHKHSPHPHFDEWYDFVHGHDGRLLDEYDGIYNDLQPFRGIAPAVIRHNVKRALQTNDFLMGAHIRGGKVSSFTGGEDWIQEATDSALEPFVNLHLDTDLAFNMHDEPWVVILYDQLVQLKETWSNFTASNVPQPPRLVTSTVRHGH